jgi:hypothetical protein
LPFPFVRRSSTSIDLVKDMRTCLILNCIVEKSGNRRVLTSSMFKYQRCYGEQMSYGWDIRAFSDLVRVQDGGEP